MDSRFELRKAGNELAPLAILALTAIGLVGCISFAAKNVDTAASIEEAGKLILGVLSAGMLALASLVFSRGRPRDVAATADRSGIQVDGKRLLRSRSVRHAYVIRDGERWSVEVERRFDVVRLLTADRAAAERLLGDLRGTGPAPAAIHRLRKKAHYPMFSGTIIVWSFALAGVVTFAFVPLAGLLLVAAFLPVAAFVTLKTVPTIVVVEPGGVTLLHPLAVRSIGSDRIVAANVVDDDAVRIHLVDGAITLDELANHPRDAEARTSAPPAERFAASMATLTAARA